MIGLYWHRVSGCVAAMLVVLLLVSGCSAVRPSPILTASFDPQAAAFIHASGKARVSGQAVVRRNNGRLLRATGTDVFLIPRTDYADARMATLYGNGKKPRWGGTVPDAAPLYEQYMRTTIGSSGGSFSFDHVADGDYYVVAMIQVPSEVGSMQFPILDRVTVRGSTSVKLVMRGY